MNLSADVEKGWRLGVGIILINKKIKSLWEKELITGVHGKCLKEA